MIQFHNVTKTFRLANGDTIDAVNNLSLGINPGEFVVIVGRSGSGKTTFLNLAAGLTRPTSGRVIFDGEDLHLLSDRRLSAIRSQKIGFVFQFPSLLPALTAFGNVLLPVGFLPGRPHPDTVERAKTLLTNVGLSGKLSAYPHQLSAGEQQRVVIARSLINQPQVLLADEPTSNLDERTETEIMELFCQLHEELKLTLLLVTHTQQLVAAGMRSFEMAEGRILNVSAEFS